MCREKIKQLAIKMIHCIILEIQKFPPLNCCGFLFKQTKLAVRPVTGNHGQVLLSTFAPLPTRPSDHSCSFPAE